ncbi:MAG: hypothetical protein U0V70_19450 [Terriglobia bacterium]
MILAWIVLGAGVVIVGLQHKGALQRQLSSLQLKQTHLENMMTLLASECEKNLETISKLVLEEIRPSAVRTGNGLIPSAHTVTESSQPAAELSMPSTPPDSNPRAPDKNGMGKRSLVLELYSQGITATEISQRLTIPRGEIELILNLAEKKAERDLREQEGSIGDNKEGLQVQSLVKSLA